MMPEPEFEDIQAALSITPVETKRSISRRTVLKAIAAGVGLASIPAWLLEDARFKTIATGTPANTTAGGLTATAAAAGAHAVASKPTGDGILVVLQLGGGNDGLNTVIPVGDGRYYDMRGRLAISERDALAIGSGMALHPNLKQLKSRFDKGKVAIVQGVGYSDPNLSHFESMAVWMSGWAAGAQQRTGWLGRYIDAIGDAEGLEAVVLGDSVPFHLQGTKLAATCIPVDGGVFGAFDSKPGENDAYWHRLIDSLKGLSGSSTGLGSEADYYAAAVTRSLEHSTPISRCYPNDDRRSGDLPRQLGLVANLINANLGIRVFGLGMGGFDTHSGESAQHASLMKELDEGINAFFSKLSPAVAKRVTLMTFSEFGRRPQATTDGTDHGTAAPMFVIGERVHGGLVGTSPSLSTLDPSGNLIAGIDFHSVYASVLDGCLGADSAQLLGKRVDELPLFT